MDLQTGAVGEIPREALRGLPPPTIRFLSNLCRELFDLGRKVDRAERRASEATSHGTELWSSLDAGLFQMRTAVEGQLGRLQDQVDALSAGQRALQQQLERVAREAAQKSAVACDDVTAMTNRQQAAEQAVKRLRQELIELGERQDSCWRTVHHHTDLFVLSSQRMDDLAGEVDPALNHIRQQVAVIEGRITDDLATHQQHALAVTDQLKQLTQRLDLFRSDAEEMRSQMEHQMQTMIESALEFEKVRRQDDIQMLLQSTEELKAARAATRTAPAAAAIVPAPVVDIMAVVNANAALFAERHAQSLDRCDTLERLLRVIQDKVQQLEGRWPAQIHDLYQTVTGECERRLRDVTRGAASAGTVPPVELGPAATHSVQSQIDHVAERFGQETRHLRRSLESLCDALAQLSAELDGRLRKCELRATVDALDGRLQRLETSTARPRDAPTSARVVAHATRQVLHQRAATTRSRSARSRSHVPDSSLTAEGVTVQSIRAVPTIAEGSDPGQVAASNDVVAVAGLLADVTTPTLTLVDAPVRSPKETMQLGAVLRRNVPRQSPARPPAARPPATVTPSPADDDKLSGW